jgi:hypothetical protein
MANVDILRNKVQMYLNSIFNHVSIDSDGDFFVRDDSAQLFIRPVAVGDSPDGPTVVHLFTPLLRGVNDGPELHKYIAFHADDYRFGHLSLHRSQDGEVTICFTHQLLGDYLDEPELGYAAVWMVRTADEIDDQLQALFGGRRFHEK